MLEPARGDVTDGGLQSKPHSPWLTHVSERGSEEKVGQKKDTANRETGSRIFTVFPRNGLSRGRVEDSATSAPTADQLQSSQRH